MLVLSKIIYFFITPFTWLIAALLVWAFVKQSNIKKIGKISALCIVFFFSNTFIYKECIRLWEIHAVSKDDIQPHEVGIVLGGMFDFDNSVKRLSIRRGGDRLWQAMDLYYAGKIKKICISGKNGDVIDKGLDEAKQVKELLIEWGIPAEDILTETISTNTYENAKYTVDFLTDSFPQIQSAVLITSARHMRRSQACFAKQGFEVVPFPTDQYTAENRYYTWDEFIIPDFNTFSQWFGFIKEMVGYVGYAATGRL